DRSGRLIAHPDISLVLRNTDLTSLAQVKAALAGSTGITAEEAQEARDLRGHRVLSAHAKVEPLGWNIFVELPLEEAYGPLYASIQRSAILLLGGLILAFLAGLLLARRMVVPIERLRAGAARLGRGELGERIAIKTGDELEMLANQFNDMAGQLQESYADLEKKVELRTHELSESLEQQTATAEVLQVVNSSPGDLSPVFDAMLEKAMVLCEAAFGVLLTYDGMRFHFAAERGTPAAFSEFMAKNPPTFGPGTGPARVLEERRVIQTIDAMDDELYRSGDPARRAIVDLAGARTILLVPLLKDDAVRGIFTIYRQEVRPFSDKHVALLENFATQAVIAMENARLITETREALEQQTATSEVLQVINSSPGDLAPVFDAMLEKALGLCGAAFGMLWTYDGSRMHAAALRGLPPSVAELFLTRGPHPVGPDRAFGRLLRGEPVVHVVNAAEDQAYSSGDPLRRALVDQGGARTLLGVPLRKDNATLGLFSIYRQEVRPFSDKEIALVQNFAAQAVIAMENARLITETREALERQTATAEVLRVISGSPGELEPVFDAILANATRICDAKFATLRRYDGEVFHNIAMRDVPPAYADHLSGAPQRFGPHSTAAKAVRTRTAVQIADAMASQYYLDREPDAVALVELGGARTLVSVPLLKDEELIGTITIYRQEVRPFAEKQIELVTSFAAQAVIAMENARLLNELRESLERQIAMSEVLRVISSSPGDLQPVFDAILANATRICEAQFGTLYRYEADGFHSVAAVGVPAPFAEYMRARARMTPTFRRMTEKKQTVHVVDLTAEQAYRDRDPDRLAIVELAHARTLLAVPMLKEGTLVGSISIFRQEVRPFTEKQIELVTSFAAQAVIAVENVRLLSELRDRTTALAQSVEELRTLGEVSQTVNSTLEVDTVLQTIVAKAVQLSRTDAGAIYVFDEALQEFHLRATYGTEESLVAELRRQHLDLGEHVIAEAARTRAPVQIPELSEDPTRPIQNLILQAGYRALLVVPLLSPDGIVGILIVRRRSPGEFAGTTIDLLQTFAAQSVVAIQNARLFAEIEEKGRQLELASRHKSQFLANMSHELRTPLNAVLGYSEMMLDGLYGDMPEKAKGVLERVQSNGKHLLGLINDVLDLSKIEAGQLTLAIDDYSMSALVKQAVATTESLARTKGLALTAQIQDALPKGRGDERRLTQVLLNLIGNAVKFTDKGEVAITAEVADGRYTVAVRDTGPGIAEADQARIFEEFQQVDNTNTRKKGGTGLGLAIAKRIMEMHGGTLTVQSAPGEGSTFRMILPVRAAQGKEAA
ncbi:MAG TPA: GAF domain-containing protein, partial [Stellaceae bacterium]|nr:GAF domain-containing protein [Stellaceae bacterium]